MLNFDFVCKKFEKLNLNIYTHTSLKRVHVIINCVWGKYSFQNTFYQCLPIIVKISYNSTDFLSLLHSNLFKFVYIQINVKIILNSSFPNWYFSHLRPFKVSRSKVIFLSMFLLDVVETCRKMVLDFYKFHLVNNLFQSGV